MIHIFIFFPAQCWWYITKGHRQTLHYQAQRGCPGHLADVEKQPVSDIPTFLGHEQVVAGSALMN